MFVRQKNCCWFAFLFFVGILFFLPNAALSADGEAAEYKYTFEVINHDGNSVNWQNLWVPVPNRTNYQYDIELLEIDPEPSKIYTDPEHDNTVLYYEDAPETISGSYEFVRKAPFAFEVNPDEIPPYDPQSSLYQLYTRAETWIESDATEIKQKSADLASGLDNPYAKARRFNDFVYEYLDPEPIDWTGPEEYFNEYGALATFERGSGSCQNYALLFVALCRAAGIPARTVHGINFLNEMLDEEFTIEDQSHAWAEFYLPEAGWITVDPSQNEFAELTNLRLVYSVGNNIRLEPSCNSPDAWYCHSGEAMSLGYTLPFNNEKIVIEKLESMGDTGDSEDTPAPSDSGEGDAAAGDDGGGGGGCFLHSVSFFSANGCRLSGAIW